MAHLPETLRDKQLFGRGDSFTGDFKIRIKEGSDHGASLSTGDLREEPAGRATLLESPTVTSRTALEMEQLPLYRGSVRGTWMKGCYT